MKPRGKEIHFEFVEFNRARLEGQDWNVITFLWQEIENWGNLKHKKGTQIAIGEKVKL